MSYVVAEPKGDLTWNLQLNMNISVELVKGSTFCLTIISIIDTIAWGHLM